MRKLSLQEYREIQTWMHRNARPVDLAFWRCHFEGGSREEALAAMAYYQNADGGFGNALEPDSWNPDSSPYTTLIALNRLKEIGTPADHPIIQGIYRYLESGAYRTEGGWHFNLPTNDHHAHAPWWFYSEDANLTESIGVTAELAGHILQDCEAGSPLHVLALSLANRLFDRLDGPGPYGDMGIGGYCMLAETVRQAGLEGRLGSDTLRSKIKALVDGSIVRDTAKWAWYGVRPSDLIKSPESLWLPGNEGIVDTELD